MKTSDMRKGVCALCEHDEVVKAELLEFGARGTSRPMGVAYGGKDGMLGFQPKLEEPHGALHAYTCRSCGYTQLFADDPKSIPIDDNSRTEIVRGD